MKNEHADIKSPLHSFLKTIFMGIFNLFVQFWKRILPFYADSLSSVKFNLAIHKVCTLCLKDLCRHVRQKKFKAHNWTGFCWLFSTFPYIVNMYLAWLTHSLFCKNQVCLDMLVLSTYYLSMTLLMIDLVWITARSHRFYYINWSNTHPKPDRMTQVLLYIWNRSNGLKAKNMLNLV